MLHRSEFGDRAENQRRKEGQGSDEENDAQPKNTTSPYRCAMSQRRRDRLSPQSSRPRPMKEIGGYRPSRIYEPIAKLYQGCCR